MLPENVEGVRHGSLLAGVDRLVYSYWHTYDIPALIIRPFNNYGSQQHLEKVVPRFITSAISEKPLTVHGDGSAARDWLYVDDHCEALDKVLHHENFAAIKNQIINLGTGKPTPVLEIAEAVLEEFGLPLKYLRFIGDRLGQVQNHISSTDRARDLIGWEATTDFRAGLSKTIEWYKNNETWWRNQEWMKEVPIRSNDDTIEMY